MKNKLLIFCFIFIISLVLVPLLKPGYIFSLDQIFVPSGWLPKIGENIFLVGYISKLFYLIGIPVWILEKILIILTFLLPIFAGYLLTKDTKNIYSTIFCCLFLVFNPFLYGRFIDGQINIYLSYAFYPLFFYFLKKSFEEDNYKYTIYMSFLTLFLNLTSLHNAIFLFFIFLIFSIFYLTKTGLKNILKILILVFIINLLWFIPLFLQKKNDRFEFVNQVNFYLKNHIQEFKSQEGNLNLYFNLLSTNGYWGENEKRFIPVFQENYWFIFFIFIFFLSVSGFFSKIEESKLSRFDLSLFSLGIVSLIFASGIEKNSIFSFINTFMYDYFPMYKGMREPHKWIMFLVIFYAYFGAIGINTIFSKYIKNKYIKIFREIFIIFLVFIPVFYVPKSLLGFAGQVKISNYPNSWYDIKTFYDKKYSGIVCKKNNPNLSNCYNSVAFPWHAYMKFNFTGKIVGTWIFKYFGDNILFGDNIEKGNIYSESTRFESKLVETYFNPKSNFFNGFNIEILKKFYKDLKSIGIKNIFLFKEADYLKYKVIFDYSIKNNFIEIEKENKDIILYKLN